MFLVALGVDYNIFLMTRVHEEARRHGTRRGAAWPWGHRWRDHLRGSGVGGTFVALGSLPLVFITKLSFAVAFGVLLDTFVVRSVLVTALNLDVGRQIWWPSSLSRKPDVQLGESEEEMATLTH